MTRFMYRNIAAILAILLGLGSAMLGVVSYRQADKTATIANEAQKFVDDLVIGFGVATKYKSSLSAGAAAGDSTINVASMKDGAGNDLNLGGLGNRIYLSVEPGTTREEIFVCTGISSLQFTGCTGGLPFQGRSEVASSTLRFQHNAGSIIQMSNVHFVYENLIDIDTEQYLSGIYAYTSSTGPIYIGDNTGTGNKCVYFRDGGATSTYPFVCHNVSTDLLIASNNGVDTFNLTPTSTVISAGRGLLITSSVITIATSTIRPSGLAFITDNDRERLYIPTSTASNGSGWGFHIDSTGAAIYASTTFAGYSGLAFADNTTNASGTLYYTGKYWGNTFTSGTAYFTNLATFYGGLSSTSTSVSSTFFGGLVATENIYASTTAFGTGATTTIANNLDVRGNINWSGLNQGGNRTAIGTFTRNHDVADGAITYTHNLGVVPTYIEINCVLDAGDLISSSFGRATGVSAEHSVYFEKQADAGTSEANVNTSNIIFMSPVSSYESGDLTALTATSFDITWTGGAASVISDCSFKVSR